MLRNVSSWSSFSVSVELSRQIEPKIQCVRIAARRNLPVRRAWVVGECQREKVSADTLFDSETELWISEHEAADTRRHLARHVHAGTQSQAAADADHPGIPCWEPLGGGVVDPERLEVDRQTIRNLARHNQAESRRVPRVDTVRRARTEIVIAFDRGDSRDRE